MITVNFWFFSELQLASLTGIAEKQTFKKMFVVLLFSSISIYTLAYSAKI